MDGKLIMQLFETQFSSPIGTLTLTGDQTHLIRIQIGDLFRPDICHTVTEPLESAIAWLNAYFSGSQPSAASVPCRVTGTPFQLEVWNILKDIPYGQTVTYGAIAKIIAAKRASSGMSAQAVGQAVRKNPLPLLIPCHRVIGADGHPVGYAYGLQNKQWLLSHERSHTKELW